MKLTLVLLAAFLGTAVSQNTTEAVITEAPVQYRCPLYYSMWYLDAEQTQPTCIHFFRESFSWNDNRANCLQEGGTLLKTTPPLQVELANYIAVVEGVESTSFFVGGTDIGLEGTWTWIDGTEFEGVEWDPTQPNGGLSQNCACLCPGLYLMCDCSCEENWPGVCQQDAIII